jgi:hypothetical protein
VSGARWTLRVDSVLEDGFGTSIASAPSGRWVAATTNVANLWQGTELVHAVAVHGHVGGRARYSADESSLALGVYVIDVATGESVRRVGDGLWLTATIDDGSVSPSDFTTPFVVHVPSAELAVVQSEYQLPRGVSAASDYSGPGAQLLLVDLDAGKLVAELVHDASDHSGRIDASASVIAAAARRDIASWSSASGEPLGEWTSDDLIDAVAVSSDDHIATLSRGGDVTIWSATGEAIHSWHAHEGAGAALVWAPSTNWLATASKDGRVGVWDVSGDQPEQRADWSTDSAGGLGVAADGESLIVASDRIDQTLTLLTLTT